MAGINQETDICWRVLASGLANEVGCLHLDVTELYISV